MIFNLGYLMLVTALVLAAFGMVAGFLGGAKRLAGGAAASFNAVYAVAALVIGCTLILWYGLTGDHFEVAYVWNHSERALPLFYKFAALWGGQDGSLLFWALVLSLYSLAVVIFFRHRHTSLMPYVNSVLLGTSLFFLVLMVFAENPFEQYGFAPPDGQGLNPLLQNYWMVIHPVMLYLGYVGMAVPFAFAVASLLSKRLGNEWVRTVRRWTLVPWMFLSAGIIMGSQWAYLELGWGGYWAWDPVENASLIPWLTATAFLHSIIIQERRGSLKVWNMVLIWATYFLVILGTFFTRSGVLQSVHSFAQSNVGPFFLVFLSSILLGFVLLLFSRLPLLRSETEIESLSSREAWFVGNNWLFTSMAFATLWGTMFPLFSEVFTGEQISVAAPWFNKVNGPLFLVLLLMMGVGPLLGWRRTSLSALRTQFFWPVLSTAAFAVVFYIWLRPGAFPLVGASLCWFVVATVVQEYWRGMQARRTATGENPLLALVNLARRNGQRYGGYLVHVAIVMIGVAIIGNEFYLSTTHVTLARGESASLAGYTFTFAGLESNRESNRTEIVANLLVTRDATGETIGLVSPQRNLYDKNPDMVTSEVGLRMLPSEDIYVVLNGWEGDAGDVATFTLFINPLTMWGWVGGVVLILGTLLALWPMPQRKEVTVTAPGGALPAGAGD
jgi:cytochrome c-type biogenesis protein CcmF